MNNETNTTSNTTEAKIIDTKFIDAKVLGFSTVAAILGATFAIAMSTSAAAPDNMANGVFGGRGGCETQQREEVDTAIESGDYETWKNLMDARGGWRSKVTEVVTEDNFDTFAAMHAAMESGDTVKANELRSELGLPERGMRGQIDGTGNRMRGNGPGMRMHRADQS